MSTDVRGITYGYARVSTPQQKVERQVTNIIARYPDAVIVSEAYTGTKIDRPKFSRLLKQLKPGDTLVCDEVSRFSRTAEEGYNLYMDLYDSGVSLVFLKEPHLNTDVYRDSMDRQIAGLTESTGSESTDRLVSAIIDALNNYRRDLIREGIWQAFDAAQSEVDYLRTRTAEGVRRVQAEGKQVGRKPGATEGTDFRETKKAIACKTIIRKHAKIFGGSLSDPEVIVLCRSAVGTLSRNSYYKYKAAIRNT